MFHDQAGCSICSIGAHFRRDAAGACSCCGMQRQFEGVLKRFEGGRLARMRKSAAEVLDAVGKVELIVMLRNDDLRRTGARRGGCRAGASMVQRGCDAGEQGLLVDLVDEDAVCRRFRRLQLCPTR